MSTVCRGRALLRAGHGVRVADARACTGMGDYTDDVRVSGYTCTEALASLPPRDPSATEAAALGHGLDEGLGLEVQEWPEEPAAPHTTAVFTVPALMGAAAYAGAVWRGLATFPPPARSFYSFAELLPVRSCRP